MAEKKQQPSKKTPPKKTAPKKTAPPKPTEVVDTGGGTPPPQGGSLAELLSALGIDPSVLGAPAGTAEDPVVWTGRQRTIERKQKKGKKTVTVKTTQDETMLSSQYAMQIFQWPRERIIAFQRAAFKAGLYGDVDASEIPWGTVDRDTLQIWRQAAVMAGYAYAAGQRITPDQYFMQLAATLSNQRAGSRSPGAGMVGPSEADLNVGLLEEARKLGAGRLSESELASMKSAYRRASAQGQVPSIEAFAEQEVARRHPVEYQSQRALEGIALLLQAFGQGGGQ